MVWKAIPQPRAGGHKKRAHVSRRAFKCGKFVGLIEGIYSCRDVSRSRLLLLYASILGLFMHICIIS